jgi:hypothetical protein
MAAFKWAVFNIIIAIMAVGAAGFMMWLLEQQGWISP